MLVRSWNLFHGNTLPPGRRAPIEEMIQLATADDPDVLCLQEVPAWALGRFTVGDVAARPHLGPIPATAEVGRLLTATHNGVLRSLFAGQGNAIQVSTRLRVLGHAAETLNPRGFRAAAGRALGLDAIYRLAWAKERRIVQAVRLQREDGRTLTVANMHCTSSRDLRIPALELERAAAFTLEQAAPEDVVVLAGDFNVPPSSEAVQELTSEKWGFSRPGPGIDHILVRGADVSQLRVWQPERRARGAALLSDHAPVELDVE